MDNTTTPSKIRFIPFALALTGLVFLSYLIHETAHATAFGISDKTTPTGVCIGLNYENTTNPLRWTMGRAYYTGTPQWYASEAVAYSTQAVFVLLGGYYLLRTGTHH